ncbi:hypothetical protein A3C23_02555 [Candidatus Roizmanbacteria bacterium RIFCSPHIGHO2_02_FULL_37_13b]|uniref:DNA-directed DNA polymerase n=1 Tax=Candidatus Roizmanbacteria bacterium RIFCSPLOWO2_02_FULL_36_11 TaxID=1802071 RepID=A0A1F7JG08_9BACT|nr:MAG: hypothetical protein A3C23_02555 [Candidatus Roizmanbacteria bacterium RIFCSPHIGHO2_02_FULL_37_13b]OGK54557.1 MAG: hypothetical protein A3H78_01565 [Candidatus Roizmanbacteria bacterium RIFCSPLOWO2_02_FULL_36_11]
MKTTNQEISQLLRSVAVVYLLQNVNHFRIIAYEKAADTVEQMNREIKDIWESGQLSSISGIGPTITQHLDEYFKKGNISYLIKTINQIPPTVFLLMKVPGLGPKKAFKLVKELKLMDEKTVIDDLLNEAKAGRIALIESFGAKSQADIIESIKLYKTGNFKLERMPMPIAYKLALEIKEFLQGEKGVKAIDILGSLRRMVSTIGDVDLSVVGDKLHSKTIINRFVNFPGKVSTDNQGEEKASIKVGNGRRVDIRIANSESYGAMLQYFTGSKAHNIKLREYALKKGYSLSEYGIKKSQNSKGKIQNDNSKLKINKFTSEESFYSFLGLQYIPPEIREGTNEIELAKQNKIPRLVELSDIKGEFHVHSSYNLQPSHDLGVNTYPEILNKAKKLGYEYIAFSDHNPKITNVHDSEIISIMKKRKDDINRELTKSNNKIDYFVSCEVDILPDGNIALPEGALGHVDLIIVSIHSSFRMARDMMTSRIMRALTYPKVKILGHPTGRLLQKRSEIDVDWSTVFKECAARDIALEINAYPERLDLPDTLVNQAKSYGCKFAINTDAHEISQMDLMFYGISVARRGWLTSEYVVNAQPLKTIKEWIKK